MVEANFNLKNKVFVILPIKNHRPGMFHRPVSDHQAGVEDEILISVQDAAGNMRT